MSKRYFNTEEGALKHMEYRRKCAYSRIEKRGDTVLGDASFIRQNSKGKWEVFIHIYTEEMFKDIEDVQEMFKYTVPLIPTSLEEKIIKRRKRIKEIMKKYKTLDVEKYTIIKNK